MTQLIPAQNRKVDVGRVVGSGISAGILSFIIVVLLHNVALSLVSGYPFITFMHLAYLVFALYFFPPVILHNSAEIYVELTLRQNDYVRLDATYSRMIAFARKLPISHNWLFAFDIARLAEIKLVRCEYAAAERLYREALVEAKKCTQLVDSGEIAVYYSNIANVLARQERFDEAKEVIDAGMKQLESCKQSTSLFSGCLQMCRGIVRLEDAEFEESIQNLKEAQLSLANASSVQANLQPELASARNKCHLFLAIALAMKTEFPASYIECSEYLREKPSGETRFDCLSIKWLNLLAALYIREKQLPLAEKLLQYSYEISQRYPSHEDAIDTLEHYERLLIAADRREEISDMKLWLRHTPLITG